MGATTLRGWAACRGGKRQIQYAADAPARDADSQSPPSTSATGPTYWPFGSATSRWPARAELKRANPAPVWKIMSPVNSSAAEWREGPRSRRREFHPGPAAGIAQRAARRRRAPGGVGADEADT